MRPALLVTLILLASASRCEPPGPPVAEREPRPGDSVRIRGRLDEDVDCRLLRAEGGRVYSLSERLPTLRNGTRICVLGTLSTVSQCLHSPSIEVDQIRAYASCR